MANFERQDLTEEERLLLALEQLSDEELEQMFRDQAELEKRLAESGPQDPDELHAWIKSEMGLDIPRVSVCEGHSAPFDFISDLFFEKQHAALLMASRGSGKTYSVAILHWLNSLFKPGIESVTFAAIESQAFIAYNHLRNWIFDKDGNKRPDVIASMMRETQFRNGSKLRVLGSTPEAVNGPHPQVAHADEIELMRDDTWRESRNMTQGGRLKNGRFVRPQDIATSTRKGPNGRVQQLIDEIEEAELKGLKPPRKLYAYCIFETSEQNKGCRVARPDLPEDKKCDCHLYVKGEWEDGSPRTLESVCNGGFYNSRGWQPFDNVIKQFVENDKETFEVQQLCAKPEMKFHYVPNWSDQKHVIRNFPLDPDNGPIFMAVDWGGTNPHAVNWYQLLKNEIEVDAYLQIPGHPTVKERLKEGTIVCFDEVYIAEIGNEKLADIVIKKERDMARDCAKRGVGKFKVHERYADPQGKAAREDWKTKGLYTRWRATREFDEHIKLVRDMFDDDLFRCDVKCKNFIAEIKEWRADETTGKQIDEFNHCMSNFRYALANIRKLVRRGLGKKAPPQTKRIDRKTQGVQIRKTRPEDPLGFYPKKNEFDEWRKSLGGPNERPVF